VGPGGDARRSTHYSNWKRARECFRALFISLYLYYINSDPPVPTSFATLFSVRIHRLTRKIARSGA
jgi:hypothetical protein